VPNIGEFLDNRFIESAHQPLDMQRDIQKDIEDNLQKKKYGVIEASVWSQKS